MRCDTGTLIGSALAWLRGLDFTSTREEQSDPVISTPDNSFFEVPTAPDTSFFETREEESDPIISMPGTSFFEVPAAPENSFFEVPCFIPVGAPNNSWQPPRPFLLAEMDPAANELGNRQEAQIALDQMTAMFLGQGASLRNLNAFELCRLPKYQGSKIVAIPPRSHWRNMLPFVIEVWPLLRPVIGPMNVRGYRPPAYNSAVGGARRSRHLWFQGVDLRVVSGDLDQIRLLVALAARLWVTDGERLQMGFAVYGTEQQPSHIHVDCGYLYRRWGHAPAAITAARRELRWE